MKDQDLGNISADKQQPGNRRQEPAVKQDPGRSRQAAPGAQQPGGQRLTYRRRKPAGKKNGADGQKTALFFVLMILLWAGLVGGGYFAVQKHMQKSEQYFTQQLDGLKAENQRITTEIVESLQLFEQELSGSQKEMQQIRREMDMIQEELELTGASLTGSDATRQSLAERITELDQQLAGLQAQLKKLEAAVRAL